MHEGSMDSSTRLDTINIPHRDQVLDEIFLVPPVALFPEVRRPETVGELAVMARMRLAEVVRRLEEILQMSQSIEITPAVLKAKLDATASDDRPVIVDVREAWEYETCHIPGSILLAGADFAALLPRLVAAPHVVVVCHHGVRSFSATMWLRERGVASAQSLAGGVEAWALSVDPAMARY